MKTFTKSAIATALIMGSSAAMAEVSGNVALASDYLFRGITQTDHQLAIQGGFDYGHESGIYAGIWASNIDPTFFGGMSDPQTEVDLYIGYAGEMANGVSYDLGVLSYNYPGMGTADTTELYASVGFAATETVSLSAGFAYSSELSFVGSTESAYYVDLGAEIALPEGFTMAAHVGFSDGDAYDPAKATGLASDYTDYSIGISKDFQGVGIDLTYIDTSDGDTAFGTIANDGTLVLTLSKSF